MTRITLYAAAGQHGVALMDTSRGRGCWHFLDPVGAQLWLRVTSGTALNEAIDALTAHWGASGADSARVRTDLTALAEQLDGAGLLRPARRLAEATAPLGVRFATQAPIGFFQQLAGGTGLLAALVLLRCFPIRVAITAARTAARLPGQPATIGQAEAVFAAVRRAARWWPGRAACLEESLAAHLAAALTGRRVTWVIGARFFPSGAHAWIETEGYAVGQEPEDRVWPYMPALKTERSN
ncbi:lasso peptide biosynthesis B2 protein [Streptomyces sp. G-5]|uniref:lasso peptide biosynthesis B2 protein n=1 Tax=Streptomyces sp. G-5 TaxID=2977231 RepID=UPI0021D0F352|nr:lasso peptide biosynthesis B2 protein [Streptomyces sp. G-5]MCU4750258.1 lasso peptide biosynthesis B2 protein [Streptomyces sp. G-5]